MVSGRLNRESNPVPGEKPGFLPQHESETSGEFVVTGERNPYPVKIKNTDEQAIPVKLTGSNVSQNYLTETVVTAGSYITLPDIVFQGTRLGVGIRLSVAAKFIVQVTPKMFGVATGIDFNKTVIDASSTATDRKSASYQMVSRRNGFTVINKDTIDFTITGLTITDFIV